MIGRAVPPGGTIGIVSPGSPYNTYSDVLRGIAWWEAHGYRVKLAKNALARTDYHAGTAEQRAADLMEMFADSSVGAIQCLRGGYGSAQVIPLVDFGLVRANPKPFFGFSDITALHCALWREAGLVTFYGPGLIGSDGLSDLSARRLLQLLRGETTGPFPRDPENPFLRTLAGGKASGRLVGGCLSDLMHTMGTPWELNLDGAIFAFEEVGSSPHGIDRALLQLSQAGKLEKVQGVVIGDLVGCEWHEGGGSPFPQTKTLEEVLELRLGSLGVPMIYGLPFGHGTHMATLPLGVQAKLEGEAGTLEITEPALAS